MYITHMTFNSSFFLLCGLFPFINSDFYLFFNLLKQNAITIIIHTCISLKVTFQFILTHGNIKSIIPLLKTENS